MSICPNKEEGAVLAKSGLLAHRVRVQGKEEICAFKLKGNESVVLCSIFAVYCTTTARYYSRGPAEA